MKARTKFSLFLITIAVFFTLALSLLINSENYNLRQLQKQTQSEQQKTIEKLLTIMAKMQLTFANDYSLCDATADFIKTKDINWADTNIASGIKTYSSDFAWIYDSDFCLIYNASGSQELKSLVKTPVSQENLKRIFFKGNKFCHFFIKTTAGIVEIHGAVIVYQVDKDRKNPPEGYLLIGKLWNTAFLEELSVLSNSKVSFLERPEPLNPLDGSLSFGFDLRSWDKSMVARILVKKEMAGLRAFSHATRDILRLVVVLGITIIVLLLLFFRKWIDRPLDYISKALSAEDASYVNILEKGRDEFGQISRLIKRFIEQKKHLADEIKQRKEIAVRLEQAKDKAQNYLSIASVIIVALNLRGEVTLINKKGCELLGREEKDILNYNWFDNFVVKSMREQAKEQFKQTVLAQQAEIPYLENAIISRDGKGRLIAWHNVYLRDSSDQIFELLSSGEDISDRKEIEKSQRFVQLGRFVSRMAHEVNNPLMIISGSAQLSLMESPENLEVKNNLKTIISECQRAKEIIMRLLKFSKPGKAGIAPVEVNKIVEEVVILIEHQFNINNIRIVREYGEALPLIKINAKELQEVMMNLLTNAEDAIIGEGEIKVKTYCSDQCVKIDIQDTGKGMTSEVLEKAFDPFFTTKDAGTGLGLTVSYNIIQANKADIYLQSLPGQGTTVTIQFPIR
ncbi:MAG: PAS domain S-box protein [Candidatus Omnitrophica bacterium]|nr:PAS domain S-box protein [Candidatus Omnitrophota bacterium]